MKFASYRHVIPKQYLTACRRISTTAPVYANPYPFPNNPEPTPHQIFHLLPDASPADVKQRYYELVKLYHPDSAESRQREPDPARRHAHFSAITRAYARLQKRPAEASQGFEPDDDSHLSNPWMRTTYARGRRYEEPRFVDDRWKDRLIWGGLIFAFLSVGAQSFMVHQKRTQSIEDHIWFKPESTKSEPLVAEPSKRSDSDTHRLSGHTN